MKLMSPDAYSRFGRILRTLRARGDRPGFVEMGLAADLVMALELGDDDEAERCRSKLKLTPEEVSGDC